MIKHIVLWKLDSAYTETEKKSILSEFSARLLTLENKIETLRHIRIFLNDKETSETNYAILLETLFDSPGDLNLYQKHPEHLKVTDYVKSLKLQRAAIDFTI